MILKVFEGLIRTALSKEFFHCITFYRIDLNLASYEHFKFAKFTGEIGYVKPKWRLCNPTTLICLSETQFKELRSLMGVKKSEISSRIYLKCIECSKSNENWVKNTKNDNSGKVFWWFLAKLNFFETPMFKKNFFNVHRPNFTQKPVSWYQLDV